MKLTRVDLPSSKGEEERQLVKLHLSFQEAEHISTHWITTWTCSINFLTFLVSQHQEHFEGGQQRQQGYSRILKAGAGQNSQF